MTEDLKMEYMKFKHVASLQQANASEHDAQMINYRLEQLRLRYEEYSTQGLTLDEVRKREQERLAHLGSISRSIR